jgi:EmrB/QacA subfamily drug resistance transporter
MAPAGPEERRDPGRSGEGPRPLGYPLLLTTVALGGILAPLNSTMLAVALPELRREFAVGHAEIAWLFSAYLIAMAVAQPLGGRLGDQAGRAYVFAAGLLGFLGFSVAAALAPNYEVLIAMRTGQALAGAVAIPNGMAMLREQLPANRLGRSIGITGSAMSAAAAVGPLLGAALLALGSWRLLFLVNAPFVAAALLALALLRYPARTEAERQARPSLDWFGALLFAALLALATVLLGALDGGESAIVLAAAVVAFAVLLVVFIQRQFQTSSPVAEWSLFRNRSYAGATGYVLLSNLVMYTTVIAIPFFVEEVQARGSLTTGALLGAVSVPVALLSPLGGRLSDSLGRRPLVVAGSLFLIAATVALVAGIAPGSPFAFLMVCLAMMGIGLGISVGPAGAAAIESAPIEMAGAAAGTNSMMRYVGSIIGVGILGAVLSADGEAPGIGLFQATFAVLLAMSVAALAAGLFVHRFRVPEPVREESAATPSPLSAR